MTMYEGKFTTKHRQVKETPADGTPVAVEEDAALSPLEQKALSRKQNRADQSRRSARGTVLFYSIYGGFVLAVVITVLVLMAPLNNWLVNFEAAQPDAMRQQVYNDLFAQPDWGKLYEAAGIQDTAFEGKDAYVAYMTDKVSHAADPTLTCQETSAGLSGNHKYFIQLDGEKIASFLLEPIQNDGSNVTGWQLGSVELFFSREQSVTVEKLPGQTVTVNGVVLDDSYTVRTVSTKAENYLPEGLHGYRSEQQCVTGLLIAPQVALTDENGQSVTLTADENGILRGENQSQTMQIPQEHKDVAIAAAKNYALFAIRKIGSGTLSKYFDPSSQLYKDVVSTPVFLKAIASYTVRDDLRVEDYYCYSDSLFSARVCLTMDVVTTKGYTKVFDIDTTFFFQKNSQGNFWVTSSTNVDTTEHVEQVRLTFVNGEEQLQSILVDADSTSLTPPQVTAPQGKVFKGWAVRSADDNGNITMSILFTPGEDGTAAVPAAQVLEPMTLYAVFAVEE